MADKTQVQVGFAGKTKRVSVELPADEPAPWDAGDELKIVGKGVPRIDGPSKASGAAKYTFDINLPGMLHAAVLRSPHPAAVVRSIDVEPAKKVDGVRSVLVVAKGGDRIIFAGQDVAAVAASRPEIARAALDAIVVEYEVRPHVTDIASAEKDDAPPVHEGAVEERRTEGDEPDAGGGGQASGNVRPMPPMKAGDVRAALAKAQVRHTAEYTTPVVMHSALESHGIVVRWDSRDKMTVWCSTQGIFSVRDEMADVFELKTADVHVITEFLGGGFGAKFGAGAPGSRLGYIAGELARQAKAPVKLMCTRHGEQVATGNRPDSRQRVDLGASRIGKLTAIHVVSHGTAGIATGAGVGRNAFAIYTRCPNRLVEAYDVYTNAGPGTAMRAPGHPQGAFALELAIDELAAKIGMDPLALRERHDEHPVRKHQFDLGRKQFEWDAARKQSTADRAAGKRVRRGYGVAASIWGDFGREKAAVATVSVFKDGTIEVKNGVQDIGGGIATVLGQIAAEVFHRPMNRVRVRYGDSEFGGSVGSGGSQTTSSVTPAVRNAAEKAYTQLIEFAAKQLKADPKDVKWDGTDNFRAGKESIAFDKLCERLGSQTIEATATRAGTYGAYPMKFLGRDMYQIAGVQFAEVEVDTWTGEVRATRMLAVHDCGRTMNELTLRSQINGGIAMGTGYALLEERVMDQKSGRVLNPNLESYKIAGMADIPEIEIELTDVHIGNNSTGTVGIGEPSTIPTAAAIACGVFDALGVPVRSLPLTPARVLTALGRVPGAGPDIPTGAKGGPA